MSKKTIVLVHGLWMTPKSWDTWAERFRAAGHTVVVPGWPGIDDRTVADIRSNPEALKGIGIAQIVDNYERIIRELPGFAEGDKPIIMGHSFGGLFTQMLADRNLGSAYVGVTPGQQVINSPRTMWVVSADYKKSIFKAGIATKFVGDRNIDTQGTAKAGSFTLVSGYVGADLGAVSEQLKGVSFTVQATNLTDERYLSSADGGSAFLGTPRTVTASLSLDF